MEDGVYLYEGDFTEYEVIICEHFADNVSFENHLISMWRIDDWAELAKINNEFLDGMTENQIDDIANMMRELKHGETFTLDTIWCDKFMVIKL